MQMTHYMELLATNQPWNLLIYMAIPVILAETIAVTELYLLFTKKLDGKIAKLNKWRGIILGVYFTYIFITLFRDAYLPITMANAWRGAVDVIAVTSYLLGVVPLAGIALLELGVIGKNKNRNQKLALHAIFVGIFLVVAHVAMISGMLNPSVFGYKEAPMNMVTETMQPNMEMHQ